MSATRIVEFLHVLSAALWLGSALFWPGAVRRALGLGPPHLDPALAQARVGLGLDLGAGLATIVTGIAYAAWIGPGGLGFGILVGAVLAFVRLALLLAVARPAIGAVRAAAARGDLEAARLAARRVPAYAGMAHLLWLLALVSMVFPLR